MAPPVSGRERSPPSSILCLTPTSQPHQLVSHMGSRSSKFIKSLRRLAANIAKIFGGGECCLVSQVHGSKTSASVVLSKQSCRSSWVVHLVYSSIRRRGDPRVQLAMVNFCDPCELINFWIRSWSASFPFCRRPLGASDAKKLKQQSP